MVVRSIGVWSAARLYAAILATLGLFFGAIMSLISMVGVSAAGPDDGPAWLVGAVGAGAIIIFPIFYAVMGFISGAISAVLYNLFAGMVGGLELNVSADPR